MPVKPGLFQCSNCFRPCLPTFCVFCGNSLCVHCFAHSGCDKNNAEVEKHHREHRPLL